MYRKTKEKIEELMEVAFFSGVSFSFITKGKAESFCWGKAQTVPTSEPLTPELLFDVASLTKVVGTTTVVLQFVQQGIIQLDQPLKTYYPSFKDPQITIRHLLTHTSDIQGYIKNRDELNQTELQAAYNDLYAGPEVGKKVTYTDAGTILLGFMLEEMVGKDVVTILTERVLEPLEMKDSTFLPVNPKNCVPTEVHKKRGLIRGTTHDPKAFVLAEHAGNAGLFSNVYDLEKFVRMYLNEGNFHGKQLLEKTTIAALLQDQTPSGHEGRSLGWDLKYNRRTETPILFHTGYTGTFLLIDVLNQEAFIFLSNRVHPVDQRIAYVKARDQLIGIYLDEKSQ